MRSFIRQGVIILSLSFMIVGIPGMDRDASGKEAAKVTRSEMEEIVKKFMPGISLISLEPAPFNGFWEIAYEQGGKKNLLYMESSGRYVISGSVIDMVSRTNLTKEKYDEINKIDVSLIALDDAVVLGDRSAPNKVIVFNDPD